MVTSIDGKINSLEGLEGNDNLYQKSKLTIEKMDTVNAIFSKKQFFEMWLGRSIDWDKKFAIVTKECNENFEKLIVQAKELSGKDIALNSYITKYEDEKNPDQRKKNDFYLLLKYQVGKITGKGKFTSPVAMAVV